MWKILRRILEEHLALHLVIPLVIGLLFNAMATHQMKKHSWSQFPSDLVAPDNLIFMIGVTLTYLVIIYHQTKKETATPIRGNDLAVLADELSTTTSYFATGTIRLKEWFDPVSQVFLSSIIKKKLASPGFRDERVLLFSRKRDMDALTLPYLDGYYAQRLAYIHRNFRTPLAFLNPHEVRELLPQLSSGARNILSIYPRWCARMPERILFNKALNWAIRIRRLDFAFMTHKDSSNSVLLVRKEDESLQVVRVNETSKLAAYKELVDLIQKYIYKKKSSVPDPVPNPAPGSIPDPVPEIDAAHDFVEMYFPD